MGTSQSHNLKTGPNWARAKRSITKIARRAGNDDYSCKSFVVNFSKAIGDNVYRSNGKSQHATFGTSGAKITKNLISFVNSVRQDGLNTVLGNIDVASPLSKDVFVHSILKRVIGEPDSTMDNDAAIVSLDKLLNEIFADCEDQKQIENKITLASSDEIVCWIVNFEVDYILEYSGELFQSHIFDKCDNPSVVMRQIKTWLHKELDSKLHDKLISKDLSSNEGQQILDNLTSEILEIWKQE